MARHESEACAGAEPRKRRGYCGSLRGDSVLGLCDDATISLAEAAPACRRDRRGAVRDLGGRLILDPTQWTALERAPDGTSARGLPGLAPPGGPLTADSEAAPTSTRAAPGGRRRAGRRPAGGRGPRACRRAPRERKRRSRSGCLEGARPSWRSAPVRRRRRRVLRGPSRHPPWALQPATRSGAAGHRRSGRVRLAATTTDAVAPHALRSPLSRSPPLPIIPSTATA